MSGPRPPTALPLALCVACSGAPKPGGTGDDSGLDACTPVQLQPVQDWSESELVDPDAVQGELGTGGPGLAIADVDGDGWLDVVMAVPVAPSLLFRNDGTGRLQQATLGLPPANAAAFTDVDGDGAPDLWLGTRADIPDVLVRNDGTGWATGTAAWEELPGATGESFGATWADLDGDGDEDAFVARFLRSFDVSRPDDPRFDPTPSQLLRNDGGVLVDATDQLPAEILDGATFQGQVLDVDLDGDLDIYLSNDFGIFWDPNDLLINDGTGRFQRGPDCGCNLTIFGMGASAGDIDQDGDVDLFNTNLGGPVLLESEGTGRFFDATLVRGADVPAAPDALASWGSALVDLDLDGGLDLAVIFGKLFVTGEEDLSSYAGAAGDAFQDGPEQGDKLLRLGEDGVYEDISEAAGFTDVRVGRAVAVGDLDRDGVPDLVTAGVPYLQTWRTTGGCGPGVTVQGLPVGAVVEATVGASSWHQVHLPGTTLSSSAPEQIIGLRGAPAADRILVRQGEAILLEATAVDAGAVLRVGDGGG